MSAPVAEAPCVLAIDHRAAISLEIANHEGEVLAYSVEPAPKGEYVWGVILRRLDGEDGPYLVTRSSFGRWSCDCRDRWRASREGRSCKHRYSVSKLEKLISRLMPASEGEMAKKKPDNETPCPPAADPTTPNQDGKFDLDAVAVALAAPFDVSEVKFKAQTVSGNRALAVPFVDARVIQDRLDDVLGVMNWQDSYEVLPDGSVVCRLKIRLGAEWITKEDVGGMSEQPDEGDKRKAAFSDSLKRAAVKFGIGRYLYRQKPQWVDYDAQKRQFVRQPVLAGSIGPSQVQPAPAVNGAPKTSGQVFHAALVEYDASQAEKGWWAKGDLVKHVAAAGKKAGFAADMTSWGQPQIAVARVASNDFVERKKDEARTPISA